jgi:hypothetical protein
MLPTGCLENNSSKDHSRQRLLPLNRTFWCWLWQILQCNTSCRDVMKQVGMLFALQGQSIDENSSAYCQSRKRILLSLVQKIYRHIAHAAFCWAPGPTQLQGRTLKAMDGSSVRLADTPKNQQEFPQPTSQNPGAGFPVMKIVASFCTTMTKVHAFLTNSSGGQSHEFFHIRLTRSQQRGYDLAAAPGELVTVAALDLLDNPVRPQP